MRHLLYPLLFLAFACVPGLASADKTHACQVVGTELNPTEDQGVDNFISLNNGDMSTTESVVDKYVAPVELIFSKITAFVDVAPGTGDSYVIYVSADGVRVQGMTCTISGAGQSCHTENEEVVVPSGVRLTLVVDGGEGASAPAAANSIEVSACVRAK